MSRVQILVSGQVQGVLFRQKTKSQAQNLGISGWVKNTDDDRVEIVAEGEKQKLDQLISWCRKGPLFANVSDVSVEWQESTGEFSTFEVVY